MAETAQASAKTLKHVAVGATSLERFRPLLGERYGNVETASAKARSLLAGRTIWHVNSTARGGGVAELLQSLIAYTRGAGVDARWVAIRAEPDFFEVTKRIHNHLHGAAGDRGELGDDERATYERTLAGIGKQLRELIRPGDLVFLHDPQTAGLVDVLRTTGAAVGWRCHIGLDLPNEIARRAWDFLLPYVSEADAFVFSRREFVWEGLPDERVWIVPPSIDAFSPKNQELTPEEVASILARVGISAGGPSERATFVREDGTPGRVDRRAEVIQDGPVPADAQVVSQVSRWDRLKDPGGVLEAFADAPPDSAHLLLAGPSVEAVADDPEGAAVLADVTAARAALSGPIRERTHLACLPMFDVEENAAIVNAIQRRSDVVVQKSLAEGFGLTVAEAMWKSRPVVASRVGGIQDQIVDAESGVLVDPHDLAGFSRAVRELIADPERARLTGAAARRRVEEEFLGTRHLIQYLRIADSLLSLSASR